MKFLQTLYHALAVLGYITVPFKVWNTLGAIDPVSAFLAICAIVYLVLTLVKDAWGIWA